MLVELYNIAMAGTMAIAGVLLTRDYVRFLQSNHSANAVVKSIQHVFTPSSLRSGTKSGYYPVLEYQTESGPISFTCVDELAANRFHIGDELKLHFSKSRRSHNRNCRTFILLSVMLSVLVLGLFAAAAMPSIGLSLVHIIISSFVVATCLFVIVRFKREQDEGVTMQALDINGGKARYWLREPTAFSNWCHSVQDKKQTTRVRFSQVFGGFCFLIAAGIAFGSVIPAVV